MTGDDRDRPSADRRAPRPLTAEEERDLRSLLFTEADLPRLLGVAPPGPPPPSPGALRQRRYIERKRSGQK